MLTTAYCLGQRVVAPAEPQLGLGVVTECAGRRLTVLFAKADLSRTYSTDTSALHRFRAKPGDTITTAAGEDHIVEEVEEADGILTYRTSSGQCVPELLLSLDLKNTDPFATLAVGRPGSPATFRSRTEAYRLRTLGRSQAYRGLGSARVELLPHQLFVAERVSHMWRPRVLLADEVGLGKTIEAGLISIRLAALGRVQSVAVVAPRALVGQWLAEFYRRFARPLTLFDAELEELPQDLLIPADDVDFLPATFERDLLIVDEAHHYYDSEVIKILAERSKAVLFLTATPSLGGRDSLFQLLHQLDPLRYMDPDQLTSHSEEWSRTAELARRIDSEGASAQLAQELKAAFPADEDLLKLLQSGQSEELLQRLVDRHGLGRSLIRNRRARLQSLFSSRKVVPHEIEPGKIEEFLISQLLDFKNRGEKVLVMVETTQDVSRWAKLLAKRTSLSVARFDEQMSLLERDRQAAWFNRIQASPGEEEPASVLLCSELGGEGRNFQVAHHLMLLGLPRHPDKLEQRIGRLDRIGQTDQVVVHVPLPRDRKGLRTRFAWLHQGLDAFHSPLAEGQRAFEAFEQRLAQFEKEGLEHPDFEDFLAQVQSWASEAKARAEQSVDPLIDRMSFDEEKAEQLKVEVTAQQDELSGELAQVLPELLDSLGVMMEPRGDEGLFFVRPGDMMFIEVLPGLPSDGTLATFQRTLANRRDDVEFLHFEHRLVQNTLDLILEEGVGKATAARWKGAPKTTVLFQFLYTLEAEGPARLTLSRFLPTQTEVLTGDLSGQMSLGNAFPSGEPVEERALERLGREVVDTLLGRTGELRPQLRSMAMNLLNGLTAERKEEALGTAGDFFSAEKARLTHLQESPEMQELLRRSLDQLEEQRAETVHCLERVRWRFDAVRMILCQE